MAFAFPSSIVNSGMDYYTKLLAVGFREKITEYFHDQYLQKMFFYKICNLDSRISNPDQRLTDDADKWATSLAGLYLNLLKPILDITLYAYHLAKVVGWLGPTMVFGWYILAGMFLK